MTSEVPTRWRILLLKLLVQRRYIAVASADRGILLLDAYYTNRELALLRGHAINAELPSGVVFSPDARFLLTGTLN
jgi:WD40 repeat protein